MNEKEVINDFRSVKQEYDFAEDIFHDDDRMQRLKNVFKGLPIEDRTILIMYAEDKSLRKVAKKIGVSHATIRNEINRIRIRIKKRL